MASTDQMIEQAYNNQNDFINLLNELLGSTQSQIGAQTEIQQGALEKQAELIDMLMGMSNEQWTGTRPVRNAVYNRLDNFMKSGMDPTTSVLYPYGKDTIEKKYVQGKNEMLSTLPEGGAMYSALGDLERDKASSYLDLVQKIVGDEYNKAYGVATGTNPYAGSLASLANGLNTSGSALTSLLGSSLSSAIGGYGASNSLLGALMNNSYLNDSLNSNLWSSLGMGAGSLLGGGFGSTVKNGLSGLLDLFGSGSTGTGVDLFGSGWM